MTKARDLSKLLSTSNGKIAGANLDVSFENISDTGTEGTKVASGTTAERGSTAGQIRFNSTTGLAEYYDGTSFKILDAPPTVSSISPTSLGQSVLGSSQSIVITGDGFSSTVTAVIIGNDATEYAPATTTRNSLTQVTITTPTNLTHTNDPYDIKVTNASNLGATLTDALAINDAPVFSTASGSLGTLSDGGRASSNLTPISFSDEESTPTLSVTTGSIPAGLTLNSNGTFSGTANAVSSNATSNFTVTATDGSETATRDYSITVEAPIVVDFLVIAGGGGGGQDYGGGGGAGGYRNSYNSETSGRGSSSESAITITSGTTYTVTVGAGGTQATYQGLGSSGGNSLISGSGLTTITSLGGGGGGGNLADGASGGSGGGGGSNNSGGSGTANQGYDGGNAPTGGSGYAGAGGGGASANGSSVGNQAGAGGNGGGGYSSSITGSSVGRAGGGGGSGYLTNGGSASDGGGNGGDYDGNPSSSNGTANTGGGAGGGDPNGTGGSGVVILRMLTATYSSTTTGSPTVSTSGSDTILTFNSSGSYTG